jgi:dihydroxyacid dehydratase/phosphogluconate dehydratase
MQTNAKNHQNPPNEGAFAAGLWSEEQRFDVVRHACPGAGACGGMYTANTMASSIEALGMSLPYSSSIPAEDPLKLDECRMAGRCVARARARGGAGGIFCLFLLFGFLFGVGEGL